MKGFSYNLLFPCSKYQFATMRKTIEIKITKIKRRDMKNDGFIQKNPEANKKFDDFIERKKMV